MPLLTILLSSQKPHHNFGDGMSDQQWLWHHNRPQKKSKKENVKKERT